MGVLVGCLFGVAKVVRPTRRILLMGLSDVCVLGTRSEIGTKRVDSPTRLRICGAALITGPNLGTSSLGGNNCGPTVVADAVVIAAADCGFDGVGS